MNSYDYLKHMSEFHDEDFGANFNEYSDKFRKSFQERIDSIRAEENLPSKKITEDNFEDAFLYLLVKDFEFTFHMDVDMIYLTYGLLSDDSIKERGTITVKLCDVKDIIQKKFCDKKESIEPFVSCIEEYLCENPFVLQNNGNYTLNLNYISDIWRMYDIFKRNPYLIQLSEYRLSKMFNISSGSIYTLKEHLKTQYKLEKDLFESKNNVFSV